MTTTAAVIACRRARRQREAQRRNNLGTWHNPQPMANSPHFYWMLPLGGSDAADFLESAARDPAPQLPLFGGPSAISKDAYQLLVSCATSKYDAVAASGESTCAICLAEFEGGDSCKHPPCAHRFHGRCLRQWFQKGNTECPVCRYDCRGGEDAAHSA